MEIKENMWIRTRNGKIHKILDTEFDIKYRFDIGISKPFYQNANLSNAIKKASYNIMNLIEKGDLVNGCEVSYSEEYGLTICNGNILLCDVDIKTILTKEQIQQNQYVVEELYERNKI